MIPPLYFKHNIFGAGSKNLCILFGPSHTTVCCLDFSCWL